MSANPEIGGSRNRRWSFPFPWDLSSVRADVLTNSSSSLEMRSSAAEYHYAICADEISLIYRRTGPSWWVDGQVHLVGDVFNAKWTSAFLGVSTFSLTKFLSSPKDQKWSRQHNEIFVGFGDFDYYGCRQYNILVADSPGSF